MHTVQRRAPGEKQKIRWNRGPHTFQVLRALPLFARLADHLDRLAGEEADHLALFIANRWGRDLYQGLDFLTFFVSFGDEELFSDASAHESGSVWRVGRIERFS